MESNQRMSFRALLSNRHGLLLPLVGIVLLETAYGCVGPDGFEEFIDEEIAETMLALEYQTTGVQIYSANFPVSEINGSTSGANSAASFAAAAMMGVQGYCGNTTNLSESSLVGLCQTNTSPSSSWPAHCDFHGMMTGLNHLRAQTCGSAWLSVPSGVFNTQADGIRAMVQGLRSYGCPALAPLYGVADHWATVVEIKANVSDVPNSLEYVKYFDACGGEDSEYNSCANGMYALSAGKNAWMNVFYKVVHTVASNDAYYNKYIATYDPPPGTDPAVEEQARRAIQFVVADTPAVTHGQGLMNAHIARARAFNALRSARIDTDAMVAAAMSRTVPGEAQLVHGISPAGLPWDYYLVPLLNSSQEAVAFIQLSATNGAFEQIFLPNTPISYHGLSHAQAHSAVHAMAAPGESVGVGTLTWQPAPAGMRPTLPAFPYYTFALTNNAGQTTGRATVSLVNGVARRISAMPNSP